MKYVNVKTSKQEAKKPVKGAKRHIYVGVFGFVLIAILGFFVYTKGAKSLFDPISIVASVTASNLKETDGRINVLLIGSDRRSGGVLSTHAVLTDTIMVVSIGRVEGDAVLISLPRDLWVKSPKGFQSKINAIYADGGAADLEKVVEDVLGLEIHYYGRVDFNIFQDTIDTLGGVAVDVETPFEDYEYPIEGNETASCGRSEEEIEKMSGSPLYIIYPCRYEHIKFDRGLQTMDGKTALKFVRSRHGTNNEGTDFARAKRQQKIMLAVKEKALSLQTVFNLEKIKGLFDAYSNNVDTDVDFGSIQGFYLLSQKMDFKNVRSIVLDDRSSSEQGGLLYNPTDTSLYGGAYVLIPRAGDYSQLHAYVQRYLFSQTK